MIGIEAILQKNVNEGYIFHLCPKGSVNWFCYLCHFYCVHSNTGCPKKYVPCLYGFGGGNVMLDLLSLMLCYLFVML